MADRNPRKIYPKDFIQDCLIDEIETIIKEDHPYLAFGLISSGIEFLGKCLRAEKKEWDYRDKGGEDIQIAINILMPKYEHLKLESELRNGMLHMMRPKKTVSLSYIEHDPEAKNLQPSKSDPNKVVLEVVEFHKDFSNACREVIRRIDEKEGYFPDDKVFRPFLRVT